MARQEDSCWNCEASWGPASPFVAFYTQHKTLQGVEDLIAPLRKELKELQAECATRIPLEQHQRAIMNVMELDMLRRCHEDRSALKQQVRELEAQLARKAVDGREGLE